MIRTINRRARIYYADYRNRGRRVEITRELSTFLESPVRLQKSGNRGQDDIYIVHDKDNITGVLRLLNPYKQPKTVAHNLPFRMLPGNQHLLHEWDTYKKGHKAGLTPAPLWQTSDAMLCSYFPFQTLHQPLMSAPDQFWKLVMRATDRLNQLHRIGLSHMDASLANILSDPESGQLVFVDFEFTPAPGISFLQQQIYDYLRLVESSMKFMKSGQEKQADPWLLQLSGFINAQHKSENIEPLLPALTRLSRNTILWPRITSILGT